MEKNIMESTGFDLGTSGMQNQSSTTALQSLLNISDVFVQCN